MKKVLALFALCLMSVGVAACATTSAPVEELGDPPGVEPEAICPRMWTCDDLAYYSTKTKCQAASQCAGQVCFADYNCNGTCVCP